MTHAVMLRVSHKNEDTSVRCFPGVTTTVWTCKYHKLALVLGVETLAVMRCTFVCVVGACVALEGRATCK